MSDIAEKLAAAEHGLRNALNQDDGKVSTCRTCEDEGIYQDEETAAWHTCECPEGQAIDKAMTRKIETRRRR